MAGVDIGAMAAKAIGPLAAAAVMLGACSADKASSPSPAPSLIAPGATASSPQPDWMVPVAPASDSKAGGWVRLVPVGTGDYELVVSAFGSRPMAWTLRRGTCAAQSAGELLVPRTPASKMVVRNEWGVGPLSLRGEDANGTLITCVDLPVDAARARQPVPGTKPVDVPLQPAYSTGFVRGIVKVWPTPSGDLLLRVEVDGDGLDNNVEPSSVGSWYTNLLWFVGQGSCADQKHILFRQDGGPTDRNSRGRQAFSLVVSRVWLAQPLFLSSSETCANLPSATG